MIDAFEKHLMHIKFREGAEKAETLDQKIAFCEEFLKKYKPKDTSWLGSRRPEVIRVERTLQEEFIINYKEEETIKVMMMGELIHRLQKADYCRESSRRHVDRRHTTISIELGVFKL